MIVEYFPTKKEVLDTIILYSETLKTYFQTKVLVLKYFSTTEIHFKTFS